MIPHYAIVPLSIDTGLAEWVPNTDTVHQLISDHRNERKIPQRIEMERMHAFCGGKKGYEELPVLNKIEAFQQALQVSSGGDLYKVMWLKAPNAQVRVRMMLHLFDSGHRSGSGDGPTSLRHWQPTR